MPMLISDTSMYLHEKSDKALELSTSSEGKVHAKFEVKIFKNPPQATQMQVEASESQMTSQRLLSQVTDRL